MVGRWGSRRAIAPNQRIRRFSEVCDKGMLTHLLQSSVDRDVHASRWLPPSCVLPRDTSTVAAFLERAAVSTGCVILKPCDGAKGNGIKLFPLLCRRHSASANSTTAATSVAGRCFSTVTKSLAIVPVPKMPQRIVLSVGAGDTEEEAAAVTAAAISV